MDIDKIDSIEKLYNRLGPIIAESEVTPLEVIGALEMLKANAVVMISADVAEERQKQKEN